MRRYQALLVSLPCVIACGCATQGNDTDPDLETIEQAAVTGEFFFTGNGNVRMIHDTEGFCYLTRIAGDFFESGTRFDWDNEVRLDVDDAHFWRLTGPANSNGSFEMRARCIRWTDFPNGGAGHFYTFPAGAFQQGRDESFRWQYLWWTDSICYLSGLEGTMDGLGEYVNVYPSADSGSPTGNIWVLLANTEAPEWTSGRAMCAFTGTAIRYGGRFSYSTTQGAFTRMTPLSSTVCMLSSVSGKFRGVGESARIVPSTDGVWLLGATSGVGPIQAQAECIRIGP
jgi:hypothetical protein